MKYRVKGEIPIFMTHSSSENIIIELDTNNDEIRYPIIELDLHELREDNEGASSDSSEEAIVADQNGSNDMNDEIERIIHKQQTVQGMIYVQEYLSFFIFVPGKLILLLSKTRLFILVVAWHDGIKNDSSALIIKLKKIIDSYTIIQYCN